MPQGLTGHSGHTFWPTSSSPPIQLEQEKRPPPQRNTSQNGHTFWPITQGVTIDGFTKMLDEYMVWYRDKRIKLEYGMSIMGKRIELGLVA